MKKSFLLLVALLSAMFRMITAVAQNESVVTLAGNAYITASAQNNAEQWSGRGMRSAFIDEGRCAVRNWNDKETVISFYFRTANAGKMNLALQAKGNSTIEVSVLGKTKKVTLKSDELARYDLGKFKVKKEGYVRLDIRGLKINGGNDFGSVASVIVGGEVCPVVAVSQDFSTHFGRRGPSVHLGYSLPKENVEWFYNEVVVPEEGDIPSSYYMACGFGEAKFSG